MTAFESVLDDDKRCFVAYVELRLGKVLEQVLCPGVSCCEHCACCETWRGVCIAWRLPIDMNQPTCKSCIVLATPVAFVAMVDVADTM